MINPAIDAQNIDTFQQTAKLPDKSGLSFVNLPSDPFLRMLYSLLLLWSNSWALATSLHHSGTAQCTLLLHVWYL